MKRLILAMCLQFTLVVSGCQNEEASAQPAPKVLKDVTPAVLAQAEQVLASYENVRDRLAKDDLAGIVPDLEKLEAAAAQGATLATNSADAKNMLKAIGGASKSLREMDRSNADEARKSFGELSRHVVALLVAVPSLQAGRFVFQCPMAQGYGKWVQTTAQLANPYMGTHMLACGSSTDWS